MAFIPKGIIPAMVTPLTKEGKVSEKALRTFADYLIEGGSHGLFVVGTTGEFYGLSPEEKKELFEITVDQARGRVPVYAGTGAITTREVIQLPRYAEEAKVDAVSVMTPMFISPSQKELIEHYTAIAASTRAATRSTERRDARQASSAAAARLARSRFGTPRRRAPRSHGGLPATRDAGASRDGSSCGSTPSVSSTPPSGSSQRAISSALWQCRSMRTGSVSTPCRICHALNGDKAAPNTRRLSIRQRMV